MHRHCEERSDDGNCRNSINMFAKYRHGGGYKRAAIEEGINWYAVEDYSTSINWCAVEFYPDEFIYPHQENIKYPDPDYPELKNLIKDVYKIPEKNFLMTHGANEAIAAMFHLFLLEKYNLIRQICLIGPVYSEYQKYAELYGFGTIQMNFDDLNSNLIDFSNKIVLIVNPNTPFGFYYEIGPTIESLLNQGAIVIVDESFIHFTINHSIASLTEHYANLYLIHSLTKFFGSAGARLGLIISSNPFLRDTIAQIIPPWAISAYDEWFYKIMIPKFPKIKEQTIKWISESNETLKLITKDLKNIQLIQGSATNYHTLILNPDFLEANNIGMRHVSTDTSRFFLNNYKIYVRRTHDFYGCSSTSFRIGLKSEKDNEPLWKALRDIA